ncbi:MAG: acetyltransferase, family [Herbinix sp.]|jgi:predicted acetyltransferase|nr:acetyltransferase, family [Herbinix sp.]
MRSYKPNFDEFIEFLERCNNGIGLSENQVPSTLYLLKNHNNRIMGALSLRHRLTDELKMFGGHIGYGIRPSERNKGYATVMLKYALDYVKELNISTIYISCDKDNIASSKVIQNNGGVLEWEGYYQPVNRVIQRYRIFL